MRDLRLQLQSMMYLKEFLAKVNPEYIPVVTSFTTLLCEHFFAEMRSTYDMPLVHQFAVSFSSCTRETIKRLTTKSFHYFTSPSPTFYSLPDLGYINFNQLPLVPKVKCNVSDKDLAALRSWQDDIGRSVWQLTVRNFSTKERPGTLPYWVYELQDSDPQCLEFLSPPSPAAEAPTPKPSSKLVAQKSTPLSLVVISDATKHHTLYIQSPTSVTSFISNGDISPECYDGCQVIMESNYSITDDILTLDLEILEELLSTYDSGDTTGVDECDDTDDSENEDVIQPSQPITTPNVSSRGRKLRPRSSIHNDIYCWYWYEYTHLCTYYIVTELWQRYNNFTAVYFKVLLKV